MTGHYDDPAAASCYYEPDPNYSVLRCRAQFVVQSIEQSAAGRLGGAQQRRQERNVDIG